MVNWIIENKEWFLSGLGILIITSIGKFIKLLLIKNKGINQIKKAYARYRDSKLVEILINIRVDIMKETDD